MIAAVIDASALVELLLDGGTKAVWRNDELAGCMLAAPHLIDAEVVSTFRGLSRRVPEMIEQLEQLLLDVHRLDLTRFEHAPLTWDAWRWRDRMSAYDALYVALAADLGIPLITADEELAAAAGDVCDVRMLRELAA